MQKKAVITQWLIRHKVLSVVLFYVVWIISVLICSFILNPLVFKFFAVGDAWLRLCLEVISLLSVLIPAGLARYFLSSTTVSDSDFESNNSATTRLVKFFIGCVVGVAWFALSCGLYGCVTHTALISRGGVPFLVIWVVACALNAAFQEILIRGFAFVQLCRAYGLAVASVVTTIIFILLHPNAFSCGPVALLVIAACSVLLTQLRVVSSGLAMPIATHAVWNCLGGIVFGVVSLADDYPSLFALHSATDTSTLISGGTMGLEGSLVTILVTCILVLVVALLTRHTIIRIN